jgi:hypothetical protein
LLIGLREGLNDLIRVIGEDTVQLGLVLQEMYGMADVADIERQLVCPQRIGVHEEPKLVSQRNEV